MYYRDMTFCITKDCAKEDCFRKLTPLDRKIIEEEDWLYVVADYNCEEKIVNE